MVAVGEVVGRAADAAPDGISSYINSLGFPSRDGKTRS
jgi:hypothetical protein